VANFDELQKNPPISSRWIETIRSIFIFAVGFKIW
jgi:hypothetical protein